MREQPGGLRLKFNLVLVPIIALSLAVLLWADYQHEFSSLMDAHAAPQRRRGIHRGTTAAA